METTAVVNDKNNLIDAYGFGENICMIADILNIDIPIFEWQDDIKMYISMIPIIDRFGNSFVSSLIIEPYTTSDKYDLIGRIYYGTYNNKTFESFGCMGHLFYKDGEWVDYDA